MTDNRNDDMDFREVTDDESVDIKQRSEEIRDSENSSGNSTGSSGFGSNDGAGGDGSNDGTDKSKENDNPNISSARREDVPEFEDVCFVCRRPESKAGKMFHLPNNISICDDCMHKTMEAVSQFDYNNLLNNPNLMNELNKNSGGFPNFGFFNMDGLNNGGNNLGGGIPNSQKIKKKSEKDKKPVINIKDTSDYRG